LWRLKILHFSAAAGWPRIFFGGFSADGLFSAAAAEFGG
jgi:hypothetical protein